MNLINKRTILYDRFKFVSPWKFAFFTNAVITGINFSVVLFLLDVFATCFFVNSGNSHYVSTLLQATGIITSVWQDFMNVSLSCD